MKTISVEIHIIIDEITIIPAFMSRLILLRPDPGGGSGGGGGGGGFGGSGGGECRWRRRGQIKRFKTVP